MERKSPWKGKWVREHDVVEVLWCDSAATGGWGSTADKIESSYSHIRSVGLLVDRTDEHIVLTTSRSESGNVLDTLAIPAGCVKRFRRLKP